MKKKKNWIRLLATLCITAMLVGTLSVSAFAEEMVEIPESDYIYVNEDSRIVTAQEEMSLLRLTVETAGKFHVLASGVDIKLVLFDETNYITKPGYTTYCNYALEGGKAYYASCGSYQKIRWRVKNGKLQLYKKVKVKNDDGTETTKTKVIKLNPGKTWIGWASKNYNGKCTIKSKSDLSN